MTAPQGTFLPESLYHTPPQILTDKRYILYCHQKFSYALMDFTNQLKLHIRQNKTSYIYNTTSGYLL